MRYFAVVLICFSPLVAENWKGVVSDKCGAMHLDGSEAAKSCVRMSMKHGQKPVFVTTTEKVFELENPEKAMNHLGERVTITGDLKGQRIVIKQIEAVK
jgi:hypothetical protein